ncbi:LPXTG cell wall anchor domain-containing protein [Levilactobacillus brevis]|nr:LPXTG cell wall anchor domain-containing protein [Levilactobacillus brevis]
MRNIERKTHYKMYKSHRGWLVAGITVTSMAVGIIASPQAMPTAQAADNTPVTEKAGDGAAENQSQQVVLQSSKSDSDTPGNDESAGTNNPEALPTPGNDSGEKSGDAGAGGVSSGNLGNDANEGSNEEPGTPQASAAKGDVAADEQDPEGTGSGDNAPSAQNDGTTDGPTGDQLEKSAPTDRTATMPPVSTGITVQNPDNLTNKVTGQPAFNVSKTQRLQYTYDHTDDEGVSTDLRAYDDYSTKYQAQGARTWLGETYATNIAQDAKGMDMNSPLHYADETHPLYIDEWMPDSGLQYFIWQSNFSKKYATFTDFRNNFTKAELATVTSILSSQTLQSVNGAQLKYTDYFMALMSMTTLEGLQNATNLQRLTLSPDEIVSSNAFGNVMQSGNLWDIRALGALTNLQSVNITLFSVNDISALGNKDKLTEVDMPYNQISDISPLATDKSLNVQTGTNLANQHILLAPITVNTKLAKGQSTLDDGVLTYTTPSFIVKDLTANNLPVKAFDNAEEILYPHLFPSSADAGNVNSNTLSWYNLLAGTSEGYGSLSTTWADTNSNFGGYIIQPYDLAENVSDLNVNIQLLQADGQQLSLGPATLISGEVGSNVNVQQNATVMTLLDQQLSKGYTFSGLILDGTGLYSDYLAGNGKANAQSSWVATLGDDSRNWTILFYKDVMPWTVSVGYGVKDDAGNYAPITNTDGTPVTANYKGTSTDKLALTDYEKDFDDYVYVGAETSAAGKTWSDISQTADIPYVSDTQAVRMVYAQAKKATVTVTDATTGQTIQVLDATTNPELKGAIGTTSAFDSSAIITPELAKGYQLVSDTTKNADGSSAIVFTKDGSGAYTITLAHGFQTAVKTVQEQISYQNQQQKQVVAPVAQTMAFATVTDQVTQDVTTYSNATSAETPELDVTGKPTDANWIIYQGGDALALASVKNPTVTGMHVVATTDPANDLTQTTAQPVTPDSADLAIVVTYAADNTTGGGGDGGNNGGGDVTPPTTTPETPEVPDTDGDSAQIDDQENGQKPSGEVPDDVTTDSQKTIAKPGAMVTVSGQAAKVQPVAASKTTVHHPVTLDKSATKTERQTLPQTNERQGNMLAIVGLALLGAVAGVFGWKKRED